MIGTNSIKLILDSIKSTKQEPEHDASSQGGNSKTSIHPSEFGVNSSRRDGNSKSGTKCVGNKENGHDEGFKRVGSFGASKLETGNGSKNFADGNQEVGRCLDSNVDSGSNGSSDKVVGSLVDVVLQHRSVGHGKGSEKETKSDTSDGTEWNAVLSKEWVDKVVHDGNENDNGDRINVLHDIVWDFMGIHLTSLGNKVVDHLSIDNPVDWVESKDLASNAGPADFINKEIGPWNRRKTFRLSERLFSSVEVKLVLASNPNDFSSLGDNRAFRRHLDIVLATKNQSTDTNKEEAKRKKVSSPKVNIFFKFSGRNSRQGSDIDAPVENHENGLGSDGWVYNNAFSRLELSNKWFGDSVVFQ